MLASVSVIGDKVAFAGHVCEVIECRQNGERKIRMDVGERVWVDPDSELLLIERRKSEPRMPMTLIDTTSAAQDDWAAALGRA